MDGVPNRLGGQALQAEVPEIGIRGVNRNVPGDLCRLGFRR